jgi:hypothetical protein
LNALSETEKMLSGYADMRAAKEIDAETFRKKQEEKGKEMAILKERLKKVDDSIQMLFDATEKMFELILDRFQSWDSHNPEDRLLILNMLGSNFILKEEKELQMRVYTFLKSFFTSDRSQWWS